MRNWFWRFSALLIIIAVLGGSVWAVMNRQNLIDRYVVATYQPVSEIREIVDDINLTDKGKFYFFAAQPKLNDRQDFSQNCKNQDRESIILGCYVSPQNIFVFDIDDERLAGVKEVTSAHEMLHVAYDRFSPSKKERINSLLKEESAQMTDERLQQRLAVYERTEPGERLNELHSIIGTEVVSISPELEEHYSTYFSDRKSVAEMATRYEQLFRELQQQQDGLVAELDQLLAQVNQRVSAYNSEASALSGDIEDFNQKARSDYFATESEFNTARAQLISRQNQLEAESSAIKKIEQQYEQKRAQLEALGSEAESLNRSLDSNLEPVPSI